jgi:putative ABC transport system substrate-binding protein
VKRGEFITLLGGAAAWPLVARGRQPRMPLIGALHAASRAGTTHLMAAYFEGLKSEGYVEAQNLRVEYRWADGVFDRTATRAAYSARVAGMAGNIPLVLSSGYDPIASGLVTSVNRPDNNITGVTSLAVAHAAKRAEFLHELVPTASKLAFLINPTIDIFTDRSRASRRRSRCSRPRMAIAARARPYRGRV